MMKTLSSYLYGFVGEKMDINVNEYSIYGEGPFYTDYLENIQKTNPTAGLASTVWDETKTRLFSHKEEIINLFNRFYALREIGSETVERWQKLIDRRYSRIAEEYEYKLNMYMENNINQVENTIHSTNSEVYQDTPISELSGDYATNKTKTDNVTKIDSVPKILEVNKAIDGYKTIINDFIDEFDIDFINVVGRV